MGRHRGDPERERRRPLRDAIASAGGFRISDGFISPLDLVAIGLLSAEEAAQLKDLETAPGPS